MTKKRSEPEHRQWMDVVANDAPLTKKEVCEWLHMSKQTLLRMIRENKFPQPDFGFQEEIRATWIARKRGGRPRHKWRAGTVRAWVRGKWVAP